MNEQGLDRSGPTVRPMLQTLGKIVEVDDGGSIKRIPMNRHARRALFKGKVKRCDEGKKKERR